MAKERRDSKNRILWKGEYQKPDGRYMYKYVDSSGQPRFVYSWTLTKSDRVPPGKTLGPCLRDIEKTIAHDIQDGIDTHAADKMTLNDLFEIYMDGKKNLRPATRSHYRYVYDHNVRHTIGGMKVSNIRYSHIKNLYAKILYDDGKKISTVKNLDICVHPVFTMAVRDNYIRKNPAAGVLSEIKKESGKKQEQRYALTLDQQNAFLKFSKESKTYCKWYPLMAFLLGTGCRIGEAAAVTWDDCDFDSGIIRINKSIRVYKDEHTRKVTVAISDPKTKAGNREIPMMRDIKSILWQKREEVSNSESSDVEVDGVSGFIFLNTKGGVIQPESIARVLNSLVTSYNKKEVKDAAQKGRDPLLLPMFSPHILRHTFCTRLCESDMNIKVIQEIMGHANISITMDIYNNVTSDFKKRSFEKIEGLFNLGQSY